MKTVIFDLDGTLVDSAPDIAAAANVALASIGKASLSLDLIRSFIGNGIPKLMQRAMKACEVTYSVEQHKALTDSFIAYYSENPAVKTVLYPGVTAMLDGLAARGIAMGICTNKNHDLTMQVMDEVGITQHFGAIIGGDSLLVSKPDPAPLLECIRQLGGGDVTYIGDSEVDATTAKAANIRFALYTEGYRKSPISDLPHDFAFDDFADLTDFLGSD